MRKDKQLKKALIKDGAVTAVILLVFGGVAFGVSMMVGGMAEEVKKKESNIRQIESQISSIKRNYEQANVSIELFQNISNKVAENALEIDSEALREVLIRLRDEYRLSRLSLKYEPVSTEQNPSLKNVQGVDMEYNKVLLEVGGISDAHIIGFVEALKSELKGIKQFDNFSVVRKEAFGSDLFYRISQGATPEMVSGQINFYWIGITEKKPAEGETG